MPQDPAALQRQIETTRAELADTIDAIAEKVSPKRAADRTKVQLQGKAVQLQGRATELKERIQTSRNGHAPAAIDGAPFPQDELEGPTMGRSIRWERVAAVGAAVVLVLARVRSKRRKRKLMFREAA